MCQKTFEEISHKNNKSQYFSVNIITEDERESRAPNKVEFTA